MDKYGSVRSIIYLWLFIFTITLYIGILWRKWFVTSALVSERLTFLKLVFKAFWIRFQSDKHLLNIEKQPYFSVLKSRLFSWCVLKDIAFSNWSVSIRLKVVLKLFILSSSRQSYTKSMFWSLTKSFNFRILNLCISLETGALFGKNFMVLMAFSCNVFIFRIQCLGTVPTPSIHRLNES